MTIKSKTFYVRDGYLEMIKQPHNSPTRLGTFQISTYKNEECCNEITLSWKEERKAEVTESQFDEALISAFVSMKEKHKEFNFITTEYKNLIKERIFKDIK